MIYMWMLTFFDAVAGWRLPPLHQVQLLGRAIRMLDDRRSEGTATRCVRVWQVAWSLRIDVSPASGRRGGPWRRSLGGRCHIRNHGSWLVNVLLLLSVLRSAIASPPAQHDAAFHPYLLHIYALQLQTRRTSINSLGICFVHQFVVKRWSILLYCLYFMNSLYAHNRAGPSEVRVWNKNNWSIMMHHSESRKSEI